MEKIFKDHLLAYLSTSIKGKINIHYVSGWNDPFNTMILIEIDKGSSYYRYTLDDIQGKIWQGLTAQQLGNDICKDYKRYILNKYFYSKNSETY